MKLHKSIAFLLSLALLLSMVPAVAFPAQAASSGTCGDNLTWNLDDAGTLTISGTGTMTNYSSSSSVPWYSSRTSITNVVIDEGVTSIGSYAFHSCKALTSVTIGDSVTSIGSWAFEDCTSLTSITIPDSVTSIGSYAFHSCKALTSVTIGDSVTSIGSWAFYNCTSLTSITIPDSVTSINSYAFYNCTGLTYNTYDNGKYLGNSNNPYHVIMDTVSTDITACTIHEDTKIIGYEAFYNCTSLTSVTIPDSVTSIGSWAFYNCTSLTSVTILDSVTSIGSAAFEDCTSLTKVIYCGTQGQWEAITVGLDNECLIDAERQYHDWQKATCTTPKTCSVCGATEGDVAHNWVAATCTTPETCSVCNKIGWAALGHSYVKGVCSVCNDAPERFGSCGEANTWSIDENGKLTISGTGIMHNEGFTDPVPWTPFKDCITEVVIEQGITDIAGNAFSNCTGLTTVTIPDGVTYIGLGAFSNCTSLTGITIPNSVTKVEMLAFFGCTELTGIVLPKNLTAVGEECFDYCPKLSCVLYAGTKTDKENIEYNTSFNEGLQNATWHYEVQQLLIGNEVYYYCPECDKTFSIAGQEMKGTIKFLNADGSVILEATCPYGRPITVPADPAKAADKTYTYTFAGWGENFSETCVGDATYTATYTPTYIEYMVEFKDWDGSILSSKTYHYGDVVELPPVSGRPADETYTYLFSGWNKTVVDCEGDAVYTARYTPMYINYTVSFLDWNGEVISEKTYHYGDTVEVPEDPTRAQADYYTYTFTGWDKEISAACAGNATYTATYEEKVVLQEALASGGTVKLVKDTQVDYLTIGNGATLDLNGYTLTADYFTSYGTVVDGTDGGNALVKVNKGIHLATENEFMPIYDSANGGYRFYRYELQNLGFKAVDSGTVKAGFRLTFANTSGYDVLSTTTDVALDTVALVSWTGSMGVTHYTFSDDTLRNYAAMAAADIASKGSTSKAMTLTLTGVDSLGENASVQFQPTVETAPGMLAQGADKTWTVQ